MKELYDGQMREESNIGRIVKFEEGYDKKNKE